MRFLLTSIGSSGDINPFIAVGRELRARGHEVLFLTNPHFQPRIEAAGLRFHPLGTEDEYLRILHNTRLVNPILSPMHVVGQILATTVEPTVRALESLADDFKPDCILRHHISYGARWVARARGVPSATAILTPLFWFSRHDPGVYHPIPLPHHPRWLGRGTITYGSLAFRFLLDRPMNRLARRLGYPASRDALFAESFDADLTLGLWSPHYRPPAPDDPAHGRICGFAFYDRHPTGEHPPAEIERFLAESPNDPPIVFTLGTSVVHHAGRFYHHAAAAARILGRRAILLTGKPEYAPPPHALPPGVRAFTYAPFSTLLPHAAATVHHGGIGTTAQGLRSGRPAVIIPFANDEFDNALRARALGVAATTRPHLLTPRRLARALSRILDNPGVSAAAADLGAKIAAEHGAKTAADALERLAVR